MSFKEVASLDADTVYALGGVNKETGKKNPTRVEGYYIGSRKIASTFTKSGFAHIHYFQTPKGNEGVWGKTDLDRKLLNITPGTMVRVTHTGMKKMPGKSDMFQYKVEIDQDNTIDVSGVTNESEDTTSTNDDTTYSDDNNSDDDDDQAAQLAASAAAEARRQKVQNLLNGKNKKA